MVIAIDGPAGAGKSTVAKKIAQRLDFGYLDTGAMYRAFTLYVLDRKVDLDDHRSIELSLHDFHLSMNGDVILVGNRDVTRDIRSARVNDTVSYISSLDFVRKKMVELQRQMGENKRIVVEGRDIGTVVFPDTRNKFYLDASVEERAKRRLHDEKHQEKNQILSEVIGKITKRDKYDSNRSLAPLAKAIDAAYVDSTGMTVDEVCEYIVQRVREKQ